MKNREQNITNRLRFITIALFVCFASAGIIYPRFAASFSTENAESIEAAPTPRPRARRTQARRAQPQRAKSAQFEHNVAAHKMACNSCHKFPSENWKQVRKGDDAFPDVTEYPQHESCLNCHRQDFFRGSPPAICSICHTNPSPRNSNRHAFPNPREIFDQTPKGKQAVSDFVVTFPHDKHIEIVSQNQDPAGEIVNASFAARKTVQEESCAVCHQTYQPQGNADDEYVAKPPATLGDAFWLKKGTFKTSPIGHTRCFSCHSEESGILPAPASCASCHTLKQPETKTDFDAKLAAAMKISDKITLLSWRRRDSSATFRHEFASHAEQSCSACHNVASMNTALPQTKKVSVMSCSPCHITATSDDGGALNFEVDSRKTNPKFQCAKCHLSYGSAPIPESHLKAIVEAGK